jgi:hypothetical protein
MCSAISQYLNGAASHLRARARLRVSQPVGRLEELNLRHLSEEYLERLKPHPQSVNDRWVIFRLAACYQGVDHFCGSLSSG